MMWLENFIRYTLIENIGIPLTVILITATVVATIRILIECCGSGGNDAWHH